MKHPATLASAAFAFAAFLISSCSNPGSPSSTPADGKLPADTPVVVVDEIAAPADADIDLLGLITSVLDDEDYTYSVKHSKKGTKTVTLPIEGDNEQIDVAILIDAEKNYYQILAIPNRDLPDKSMVPWVIAANQYNVQSANASVCVNDENDIVFWLGRNTDDGAVSRKAFLIDLYQTINAADEDMADLENNMREICQYISSMKTTAMTMI
ncbi:MAG: hypothetical protein K2I64_06965 [Muribaculaceae bacterium]|nr:hypothetical protein [Muribaculaceae bacterium]